MTKEDWDGTTERREHTFAKEIHGQRVVLAALIVCFAMMTGALAIGMVQHERARADEAKLREKGQMQGAKIVACVLETLAELNDNQKAAHDQLAEVHGLKIERPEIATTPDQLSEQVQQACREFRR